MATIQPEEQLEYDDFVGLTVGSFKDFLALRGLRQTGKKVELVARAFRAYELGIPKKFTQEQIFDTINSEYSQRLKANEIKSDPSLTEKIDIFAMFPRLEVHSNHILELGRTKYWTQKVKTLKTFEYFNRKSRLYV